VLSAWLRGRPPASHNPQLLVAQRAFGLTEQIGSRLQLDGGLYPLGRLLAGLRLLRQRVDQPEDLIPEIGDPLSSLSACHGWEDRRRSGARTYRKWRICRNAQLMIVYSSKTDYRELGRRDNCRQGI
jgi:hypothetical protein